MGQTRYVFIYIRTKYFRKKLPVFNHGNHVRDFTYIDDVVNGLLTRSIIKIKKYSEFLILEMENQ